MLSSFSCIDSQTPQNEHQRVSGEGFLPEGYKDPAIPGKGSFHHHPDDGYDGCNSTVIHEGQSVYMTDATKGTA